MKQAVPPSPSKTPRKHLKICDSVSLLIDEIVENGRELKLEMNAEDIVELKNFRNLTIDELIELKKQSTVEEIDEDFKPREKGWGDIMMVAKLTKGLNLIEAGMTVQIIDSDEQSVATIK